MIAPWTARVLTLLPEMFPGPLGASLIGKALEQGVWALDVTCIRDYATDKHRSVDDTPAGGEVAACVLIEATVRLLPGVIGDAASLDCESFEAGLLEYPHYTRPREWEGREIPQVLLSGDHKRIDEWRRAQAEKITMERRPDLWEHLKITGAGENGDE